MKFRCLIIAAALACLGCTPAFDVMTYHDLSWLTVRAEDMAKRCPKVTAGEIHEQLVLRSRVAYEQETGRKYAGDLQTALGRLVDITERMEKLYRAPGQRSQAYCIQKLDDIAVAVARIRVGFAKVEHANTPLSP